MKSLIVLVVFLLCKAINCQENGQCSEVQDSLKRTIEEIIDGKKSEIVQQIRELLTTESPKVLFQAQNTEGGNTLSGNITYNVVGPNIGGGMNGPKGEFRAPIGGLYRFTFTANSGAYQYGIRTYVYAEKNGSVKLYTADLNEASWGHGNNIAAIWVWELMEGDVVTIRTNTGSYLNASDMLPVIFTGELVSNQV